MPKWFSKNDRLEYEFLPAVLEIAETPPSSKSRAVVWLIIIMLVIAIVWACLGRVDVVAVARGKVIPYGKLKTIQPFEEGIITGIYVVEGQRVKKGQRLIELDSTKKGTDLETVKKSLETSKMERDLLKTFFEGRSIHRFVQEYKLPDEMKNDLLQLSRVREREYQANRENLMLIMYQCEQQCRIEQNTLVKMENSIPLMEEREARLKERYDWGGIEESNLKKVIRSVEILEKEEKNIKALFEEGVVSRQDWETQYNELVLEQKECDIQRAKVKEEKSSFYLEWKTVRDELLLMKHELQSQIVRAAQAKLKYEEAKQNIEKLKKETEAASINDIVAKDKNITNLNAELKKAERDVLNHLLCSPVDGIVQGLIPNTIGGVVTPAQPVMTIVPDGTALIVEAMGLNKDIGFIRIGQDVALKFDTFSFQKYGAVKGKVVSVSPDAIDNERLGLVYKINIGLNSKVVSLQGKPMNICPGMTVTAEIKTGTRRIVEFFFEPIIKYTDESLKLR
jgi:hemolysin D